MWKKVIPYNGFASESTIDEMYSHLPILAVFCFKGKHPEVKYVDKDNWADIFVYYRGEFKYWMPCGKIDA